jgi:hypothetical protein
VLDNVKRLTKATAGAARRPMWVPPGHYYSPVPGPADTQRALRWRETGAGGEGPGTLPGIELNAEGQRALFGKIAPCFADVPTAETEGWRYHPDNNMYGLADAAVYHGLLRHIAPRRVVEVGSGFSSAIALDTADRYLADVGFTFIEPYPERLLGLLSEADKERCTLLRQPVQDAGLEPYAGLAEGDILFIDSTHVGKAGSDVNFLLFEVLPRLAPGVYVHVHDILWPFEYSDAWLRQGRGWNEAYLLRAFLTHNTAFEIELFNDWIWKCEPDLVRAALPAAADQSPGGIWLRRTAG